MALVLHISDLHLSASPDPQVTGDYKISGLVPIAEQQSRLGLLRASLSSLGRWLRTNGAELDAMVISGDLSLAFDETGFAALNGTLDALGSKRPEPQRVVVVPGNHDIKRGTEPSTAERYETFIRYVRGDGYVTPLLEGVDLDTSGGLLNEAAEPLLVGPNSEFLIAAMNSTNYSGSIRELAIGSAALLADLRSRLDDTKFLTVLDELDDCRNDDVVRISPAQFAGLRSCLNQYTSPAHGGPLRVLVLHHQLLPVSPDEEFKTFESISNLGQLREFIVAQEFSLVLHGHKHQAATYVDQVAMAGEFMPRPNNYLVSSAATVWRQVAAGHEFARLIEIDSRYPRSRRLTISSARATQPGSEIGELQEVKRWIPRFRNDLPERVVIRGNAIDDVYERVLSLLETNEPDPAIRNIRNLLCEIEDGTSALKVPENYPDIEGVSDKQAWADEIVAWWQKANPDLEGRGRRFNHGERIRRFMERRDQINDVVKALKADPATTRGIVQLIDPMRDDVAEVNQRIPSFHSVHFLIEMPTRRLDAVAYFRKQQMRMWWPINVAEVATLQHEVVEKLVAEGLELGCGSIATFAALAVDGTNKPRVIVPKVDRLAQDEPEYLWRLAYDLFFDESEEPRSRFLGLFDDWRPTGRVEHDGVAVATTGMRVLSKAVPVFAERSESEKGDALGNALTSLLNTNLNYAEHEEEAQDPSDRRVRYERWSDDVNQRIKEIEGLITDLHP